MIKKITQYLLQRRYALSLLLMLILLQPVMAQIQTREMYARLDRETQTLTLYYDKNKQTSDNAIYARPLWANYVERKAIQTVVFDESFKHARPKSCDQWFYLFEGLTKIEHLDYLNTSEVENMGSMFSKCTSLETLDLSSFNTEKVTNMSEMFVGSTNLRTINLPKGFIGSNVTDLNGMFRGCASLTELDLSGSNAEKVKNMGNMFDGCVALSNLNLSGFKTGSLTDMRYLFSSCQSLESLDLSGFNTENVSSMVSMFSQCSSLRSLDLSSFNTSKVIDMNLMFYMCTNLESIDLSSFDTENLQQMAHMFYSCTKLEMLDLSSFATPNMTSMLCAFQYCKNLKTIYVTSAFTTDKVTEGPYAFAGCVNLPNYNPDKTGVEMAHTGEGGYLTAATASWVRWDAPTGTLSFHRSATKPAGDNILDLSYGNYPNWDTHAAEIKKVVFKAGFRDETHTTCSKWFSGCTNLTSIEGIENLNTSNVKYMNEMFGQCSNLETLDLSHFNTEKVGNMSNMFNGCTKLHDLNISSFNTENVTNMYGMFYGCSSLETLDLSHFNTRYVRNDGMNYMFNGCSSLSSLDVSNFTTDKPSMQLDGLFQGCSSLQTLDLSSFDISGAGSVNYLFDGCSALQTIYVSDLFKIKYGVKSSNMFRDCHLLKGAISFEPTKKDETYANYKSGYLTKKVGTNGNEIIGATGYPLTIDALPLDDSKAYTLYEDCNVTSASYARAMKSEWGTLCLPFTIDPTSEANTCNFYTLQNIGNESVVLELIENGTVEAGQPVVIRKKDNTQTDIQINNVENTQVVKEPKNTNTGNRLMGTFTNMELADDCYFIANNQFRLVSNYKPATSGVKLAAFRAYIQPQKTNVKHAPSLNISVDDKTTGIENTNVINLLNDKEAEYYDVNGRRIQNLQKGINIVKNGNKTMKIVCR